MPYTTSVSGTVITASWANANVRDQVVTPFATGAARTSAITSPVEGQVTYLTDLAHLEVRTAGAWMPIQMRTQAVKFADQIVNNSTALQNDNALAWAMTANSTFLLELHMRYSSGTVPDAKIAWSVPAGCGMSWNLIANDSALVATITGDYDATSIPAIGGNGAVMWAHAAGMVTTVASSGTLQLQWAQNTANVSDTVMRAGSYGFLTRVT